MARNFQEISIDLEQLKHYIHSINYLLVILKLKMLSTKTTSYVFPQKKNYSFEIKFGRSKIPNTEYVKLIVVGTFEIPNVAIKSNWMDPNFEYSNNNSQRNVGSHNLLWESISPYKNKTKISGNKYQTSFPKTNTLWTGRLHVYFCCFPWVEKYKIPKGEDHDFIHFYFF